MIRHLAPKALWFVALLLLALPAAAQHGGEQAGHGETTVHKSTLEMSNGEFFTTQFSHLIPHAEAEVEVSGDPAINELTTFYNVNKFQLFIILGMIVLFTLVRTSFGATAAESGTNWLIRVFRGWCHWLRDEVVYAVMGEEEGRKWAPFFLYVFFFVVFMNLVGLVPGSVTATASVFVTGALAVITFACMLVGGMMKQGVLAYWKNLLPHGLPVALIPLMAFVEVLGLLVKPFALMIRLFANMLAGHLLIYSFVGLIFVFAKMLDMGALSWATALPAVGMAVFINIIEAFVVLLQAYIFTYLSVLFIQASLHPEH